MFKVKVVFDNKIVSVYEGTRLIHSGQSPASHAFARNVINRVGWKNVVSDAVGHREVYFLES